jgi:response regulator RpfG family c-di-GMP phosphodiesterase
MDQNATAGRPADILVVDDTQLSLQILRATLRQLGHGVRVAVSGEAALAAVGRAVPDLILLDVMMPGVDGLAVLHILKADAITRDVPVIMISAMDDPGGIVQCIEDGAEDYLTKPPDPVLLRARVNAALDRKRALDHERSQSERAVRGAVRLVTEVLALASPDTLRWAVRVRDLALRVAREMGEQDSWETDMAATLSQLGTLALPAAVVDAGRRGTLTAPQEAQAYREHPRVGARVMRSLPALEGAARIVEYQHKDYDGGGFPADAVAGDAIPQGARILHVVADYETLVEAGASPASALAQLRGRPDAYDPRVMVAMVAVLSGQAGR